MSLEPVPGTGVARYQTWTLATQLAELQELQQESTVVVGPAGRELPR